MEVWVSPAVMSNGGQALGLSPALPALILQAVLPCSHREGSEGISAACPVLGMGTRWCSAQACVGMALCGTEASPWGLGDGERAQRVSRTSPSIPVQGVGDCMEVGVTLASPHAWGVPSFVRRGRRHMLPAGTAAGWQHWPQPIPVPSTPTAIFTAQNHCAPNAMG